MPRKVRNQISARQAIELFEKGYSLDAKIFNYYQLRISHAESKAFYDWYHTTGSLVENKNGSCGRVQGEYLNAEDVAIEIKRRIKSHAQD